jgi:hypothetical protein
MKFTVNKNEFVDGFLRPINKIADRAIISLEKNKATSLVLDGTSTLFLYCETNLDCDTEQKISLNIGDVLKFLKAVSCIDEDDVKFTLNKNHLQYKSPALNFKYHLLEDGVIPPPTFNIEKLTSLPIDTSFSVSSLIFKNIIKSSSFTTDSNKIYFYTKGGKVFGELNDKTVSNLDSIDLLVADSFDGNQLETPVPLKFDWLQNFAGIQFDEIKIKYNKSNNIVIFNIENKQTSLKYIVSTLTK